MVFDTFVMVAYYGTVMRVFGNSEVVYGALMVVYGSVLVVYSTMTMAMRQSGNPTVVEVYGTIDVRWF